MIFLYRCQNLTRIDGLKWALTASKTCLPPLALRSSFVRSSSRATALAGHALPTVMDALAVIQPADGSAPVQAIEGTYAKHSDAVSEALPHLVTHSRSVLAGLLAAQRAVAAAGPLLQSMLCPDIPRLRAPNHDALYTCNHFLQRVCRATGRADGCDRG